MQFTQPGILAPLPVVGRYVFFSLQGDAAALRTALAQLRSHADGARTVVAIGTRLAQALDADIPGLRIAIPGKYTTANFLLSLAFPDARDKTSFLFSDIEDAVLDQRADAGLIIHENRFTYASKGLVKLIDLGAYWEETTGMPIPLGGIAIRRALPADIRQTVGRVLRRSVEFALDNPRQTLDYVRCHAQEMDEAVMFQHIHLYVNEYTRALGTQGRAAVQLLFERAREKGLIPDSGLALFG